MMNLSDDEREELEAQLADVDEKILMVQILMELQQIRVALTEPIEESTEQRYTCSACGSLVDASQRRHHLTTEHNAPEDVPIDSRFTQV